MDNNSLRFATRKVYKLNNKVIEGEYVAVITREGEHYKLSCSLDGEIGYSGLYDSRSRAFDIAQMHVNGTDDLETREGVYKLIDIADISQFDAPYFLQ